MSKITNLFDEAHFPDERYNGLRVRVLLNPAGTVWDDHAAGGFHANVEEQSLLDTLTSLIEGDRTTDEDRARYTRQRDELTARIDERVARMGRALVALYGETEAQEIETDGGMVTLDFSTPETAMATVEDKRLPDELTFWLWQLPGAVIARRRKYIADNLAKSFGGQT